MMMNIFSLSVDEDFQSESLGHMGWLADDGAKIVYIWWKYKKNAKENGVVDLLKMKYVIFGVCVRDSSAFANLLKVMTIQRNAWEMCMCLCVRWKKQVFSNCCYNDWHFLLFPLTLHSTQLLQHTNGVFNLAKHPRRCGFTGVAAFFSSFYSVFFFFLPHAHKRHYFGLVTIITPYICAAYYCD